MTKSQYEAMSRSLGRYGAQDKVKKPQTSTIDVHHMCAASLLNIKDYIDNYGIKPDEVL